MPGIIVPALSAQFEPAGPGLATLEKPVTLICGPVLLPGGASFVQETGKAGFFLYRQPTSGTAVEVWDGQAKQWKPSGVASTLQPKPLQFKQGDPSPWQGLLVPAAEQGAIEAGTRQYFLRAFFSATVSGVALETFSAPTANIRFIKLEDAVQGGIRMTPKPETASEIELFLRDAAKQVIGSLKIRNESNQARIEITNAAGALISLRPDGDIEIRPAVGRTVRVTGALETEQIRYEPANGTPGVKQLLNIT